MIPRILLIAALGICSLTAAEPSTEDLLRQGLFEEEANRDFDKAAESYRAVIAAHDKQRAFAATATYRLGEIARKKNDKEAAANAFKLVAERYPEQSELARLSRENLVALGVSLASEEKADSPPAITAVDPEETEIARLKDIAKNSPDLLDGTDDNGWRPIHRAAKNGWTKVISYLLENKADPDSRTLRESLTPLQVAATYGQLAAVNSLIAAKADIQAVTSDENWNSGWFPQRENAADHFNGNWRALDLAILYNRKEIARTLLEAKADPALSGPEVGVGIGVGMADTFLPRTNGSGPGLPLNPLQMAILLKRNEIALELLKAGAPLTAAEGKKAPTALQCAVIHNPVMVEVLLKAKADPTQGFPSFQVSPLHEASNQGLIEIAKLLLDAGADAKAADAMGGTPLHFAGNAEMVDLLVSKGADPNAKDKSGHVPLDALAMRVDPKAMEALLKHGATVADPVALLRRTNELTISFVRERIAYPKLQSEDAILLSFNRAANLNLDSENGNSITLLDKKPAPGSPPPTLAEGLWPFLNSRHGGNSRYLANLRILRRKDGGGFETAFEWTPKAHESAPEAWPALEWGDIVEFNGSFGNESGAGTLRDDSFGKLPPRKVKVRMESWTTSYDLTDSSIAARYIWLSKQLANVTQEVVNFADLTHISVIRKGLEKPIELDLSKQKHPGFRLIDGDVIDLKFSDSFWSRVPDKKVSVLTAMLKRNNTEPGSLIPILASHHEGVQTDWRHVRILQRGGDKPSGNIDVVEWIRSLPPREKWNKDEILAKDLKIQAGEVVMIPPLRDGDEAEKKTASETSDRIREVAEFLNQTKPGE